MTKYDLEERTMKFSKEVRLFLKTIKPNFFDMDIIKQLLRSSSSVGANYVEASESFSRKDYVLKVKICRKEIKETIYWLKLLELNNSNKDYLINEAIELMRIFGALVVRNSIKI